jgi:hypothetical protein
VPAPPVVIPLKRRAVFRLVLWSALDGLFVGFVLAAAITLLTGASVETGVLLRLFAPAGMLVGGLAARVRAPAMGIIVDDDGIELHGFWRTRRVGWTTITAIGWAAPGHRFAVRTTDGRVKAGAGRLPRRIPPELARAAAAHGVEVVAQPALASAPQRAPDPAT